MSCPSFPFAQNRQQQIAGSTCADVVKAAVAQTALPVRCCNNLPPPLYTHLYPIIWNLITSSSNQKKKEENGNFYFEIIELMIGYGAWLSTNNAWVSKWFDRFYFCVVEFPWNFGEMVRLECGRRKRTRPLSSMESMDINAFLIFWLIFFQ